MQGQTATQADVPQRVQQLLAQMTLAEKVGQMTQPEKNSVTPAQVTEYALGSVLSGGGGNPSPNSPQDWRAMVVAYQEAALKTRLQIPLIYGSDAVHGHNNVRGAVIFPHNIGLGATRDAELVRRVAAITARELLATSVHWDFAPAVSVPQDIRWGRTYEGYSEDTELVRELALSYMRGLHESGVLASVKHFVGDGGTTWGSTQRYAWITGNWQAPLEGFQIDQGDTRIDEATLRRVHLPPYIDAIQAGAQNIMVSFSSWNGDKLHGHKYLLTDVLKGELGFEGFLVSDWMAIDQLGPDYAASMVTAINAGLDMVMVPFDFKRCVTTLITAIEQGDISLARIDDAVSRILTAKMRFGLFDAPFGEAALLAEVGSQAHRDLARQAVQKSLVLLKNEGHTLPIARTSAPVLLAGRGADNIGMQCGGWTLEWLGGQGPVTQGTSLYQALQDAFAEDAIVYSENADFNARAEVGIVVVGENPYAEGLGDNDKLTLSDEDRAAIEKTRAQCERLVVVLLSGRPLLIADQLAQADAFVAAWLPGSEGAGVADALLGDAPFTGKLSYTWPRNAAQIPLSALKAQADDPLFPLGYGLHT